MNGRKRNRSEIESVPASSSLTSSSSSVWGLFGAFRNVASGLMKSIFSEGQGDSSEEATLEAADEERGRQHDAHSKRANSGEQQHADDEIVKQKSDNDSVLHVPVDAVANASMNVSALDFSHVAATPFQREAPSEWGSAIGRRAETTSTPPPNYGGNNNNNNHNMSFSFSASSPGGGFMSPPVTGFASQTSMFESAQHGQSFVDVLESNIEMDRFVQSLGEYFGGLSLTSTTATGSSAAGSFVPPQQVAGRDRDILDPHFKLDPLDVTLYGRKKKVAEPFVSTTSPLATVGDGVPERHREWLQKYRAAKAAPPSRFVLRELNADERAILKRVFAPGRDTDIVSEPVVLQTTNIELKRSDVARMKERQWLNDECINVFMKMLQKRSEESAGSLPSVYCFNSFFYELMCSQGYTKVQRWTRSADVLSKDMILFPVHLGSHWCMAVINLKAKRFEYYDSLLSGNAQCLKVMREYVSKESLDKKKKPFDFTGWQPDVVNPEGLPQQMNTCDCGVFAVMFADSIALGEFPKFKQDDMPLLRQRMTVEICTGKFLKKDEKQ